jgi:hypothetical protein
VLKELAPEIKIIALASALYLCGWFGIRAIARHHHLGLIPSCLRVTDVVGVKESLWGVGPGGNETGVVVFAFPENSALSVANGGTEFLKQACSDSPASRRGGGRFRDWKGTPMTQQTMARENSGISYPQGAAGTQRMADFLDQYGLGIALDPATESMIDNTLAEPGNDYHCERTSLLIVIPEQRRVVYAYAG